MSKLNATIAENMAILRVTVQNHVIMLILHKKISETSNLGMKSLFWFKSNSSVNEECAMMCMDIHYEDG